ncbi:hypothetical protein BGZ79_006044, partial [Entomortierella chlamydospora]
VRQHDNHRICEQVRGNTFASVDASSGQDLAPLPSDGNKDFDHVRAVNLQSGRRAISSPPSATRVVSGSSVLPASGSNVGPSQCGHVCVTCQQANSSICVMETSPSSDRPRCVPTSMDDNGQHLPVPSMEPDFASPPEAATGQGRGDIGNAVLAVSSLVPNSEVDGHLPPDSNTQESGQATSRKRPKHPGSQSALESLGME